MPLPPIGAEVLPLPPIGGEVSQEPMFRSSNAKDEQGNAVVVNPGDVRKQIVSGFAARPMFEPGANAAMLGALSDPSDVAAGVGQAVNPLNIIRAAISAARLVMHPSQIHQ